ncbi:MAG: DUF63 family protein [Candidatus Nanohalobium sp.]
MWFESITDLILFTLITAVFLYFIYPRIEKKETKISTGFYTTSVLYLISIGITSATGAKGLQIPILLAASAGITFFLIRSRTKLEKNISSYRIEAATGLLLLIGLTMYRGLPELIPITRGLSLTVLATAVTAAGFLLVNLRPSSKLLLPVAAHYLDAASTVVALQKSLKESRFLANLFIKNLGPGGIIVMKALVIIPVVYFSTNFDEEYEGLLLYIVFALGLVLGVRNLFLI